jgi:hypothetical protein
LRAQTTWQKIKAHHRILEDRLKEQQPQGGFTIDSRRFQPAAMKEKAVFPKKYDEPK